MTRHLLALGAAVHLLGLCGSVPAFAAEDEDAFRAQPTAATAVRLAREALARGNPARAINWAERAARSPGLTPDASGWIGKLRADLRWRLADDGFGALQVNVRPAAATVTVDGHDLLVRTGAHLVWLKEGSHHIHVSAADHSDVEEIVETARGERRAVDVALVMTRLPVVVIDVQPECDVWIDGSFAGPSTRKRFSVKPGPRIVELRRAGWRSFVKELTLTVGEVRPMAVQLESSHVGEGPRHTASTVDRPLTERELGAQAERHTIGTAPSVDSPLDAGLGLGKKTAAAQPGAQAGERPRTGPAPGVADGVRSPAREAPDVTAPTPNPPAPAPSDGASLAASLVGSAPDAEPAAAPWSAATKGWLWAGPGLAVAAGGVGLAVFGARQAETANQEIPRGAEQYAAAYDQAKKATYLGYAAASVGVVATSVGAWYLVGRDGLSRKGKGWATALLGVAASGIAGWLYWDARTLTIQANELAPGDGDYDRRFDVAQQQAWTAYGVGAGGVLLVGTGAWLAATSARTAGSLAAPLRRVAILPAPGGSSVTFLATW